MSEPTAPLSGEHRAELHRHAVSDAVIAHLGIRTGREGIVVPWPTHDGQRLPVGRRDPEHRRPGAPKYVWPSGRTTVPGIFRVPPEPGTAGLVAVVEGVLQAAAVASWAPSGWAVVAMNGADGIHGASGAMPWARGARMLLLLDRDAETKAHLAAAAQRVAGHLLSAGAADVRRGLLPPELIEADSDGADDVLARLDPGERTALLERIEAGALPVIVGAGLDLFSDAVAAARLAVDRLTGRWRHAPGIGWLEWDGRAWRPRESGAAVEIVRVWVIRGYQRAKSAAARAAREAAAAEPGSEAAEAAERRQDAAEREAREWTRLQAAARLRAVAGLAQSLPGITVAASALDAHPDLLNTPSGVVDLRTGDLGPHDPGLLMTRITAARYVPGARHRDWTAALSAVPDDAREWLQLRFGQAATGRPPPDDTLVFLDGPGENGKTTIVQAVGRALGLASDGGYAATSISHRAITGDNSQHPTEIMVFRGLRFAAVEEIPDSDRSPRGSTVLNITRIKDLVGKDRMTARSIAKDPVEWQISHSLFVLTNHIPVVLETDHGTWRRLLRLRLPYVFRKPWQTVDDAHHRPGDESLKSRLLDGDDGRAEAVLSWLVEGARRFYGQGATFGRTPDRVAADVAQWRQDVDVLGHFAQDRLVPDPDGVIPAAELYRAYQDWSRDNGHRPLSARAFGLAIKNHGEGSRRLDRRETRTGRIFVGARLRDPYAAPDDGPRTRSRGACGGSPVGIREDHFLYEPTGDPPQAPQSPLTRADADRPAAEPKITIPFDDPFADEFRPVRSRAARADTTTADTHPRRDDHDR
jgi:P4 family phage/plasmid primase-like protien